MKERTLWTVYLPDKSKDESVGVYDRLDDARRYGIALAKLENVKNVELVQDKTGRVLFVSL